MSDVAQAEKLASANGSSVTIEAVSRKKLDPKTADRIRDAIREVVRERFNGNQRAAADALDISPPHLSDILNKNRDAGTNTLISLRNMTGRSLDEILGLPPLRPGETEQRLSQVEKALAKLATAGSEPTPAPKTTTRERTK
jgi:hypothetical protein